MNMFEAILALFDGHVVTIIQPTRTAYSARLMSGENLFEWTISRIVTSPSIERGRDTLHLDLQNITDLHVNVNQKLAIRVRRGL